MNTTKLEISFRYYQNDFYENMDRIALEETIPKSLVFMFLVQL